MKARLIFSLMLAGAVAPSVEASDVKPSLEVVVLGSGGPRAFGKAGSSYMILLDRKPRILLDAGPGAFVRIGELHLDLGQVDIVLLTHLHIHHSSDLAAFFNARALSSDGPIKYRVFGPDGAGLFPKTSRFVDLLVSNKGMFAYQKTFGAEETFSVRDLAIDLNTGVTKILDENGLIVEEIATHHGDCPSVAYRITYQHKSVVFPAIWMLQQYQISFDWPRARTCWFSIVRFWTRQIRQVNYTNCTLRQRKLAKRRETLVWEAYC